MRLRVFGDSYSIDHYKFPPDNIRWQDINKSWVDLVAEQLEVEETIITAQPGVSNSWIYYEILQVIETFTSEDIIIIQLTSKTREWLIERHPTLANWQGIHDHKSLDLTSNETDALRKYKKYLNNDLNLILSYDMFVRALMFIASNTSANILILPGFDPVPGCTGTLGDICFGEFDMDPNLYYTYHSPDPRVNHMHEVNHKILASKICNFFQNHECVNLLTGFKRGFININNYKEIQQIA